jgi:hypothetical protein
MIEFKIKCSLKNGNKLTTKNVDKVTAVSSRPCTNVHTRKVDEIRNEKGVYFETWRLVYEKNEDPEKSGFIFREIIHGGGIGGRHRAAKDAIYNALEFSHISVFLEE